MTGLHIADRACRSAETSVCPNVAPRIERSARNPPGVRCCRSSAASSCNRLNQESYRGRFLHGQRQNADIAIRVIERRRSGNSRDDHALLCGGWKRRRCWRGRWRLCAHNARDYQEGPDFHRNSYRTMKFDGPPVTWMSGWYRSKTTGEIVLSADEKLRAARFHFERRSRSLDSSAFRAADSYWQNPWGLPPRSFASALDRMGSLADRWRRTRIQPFACRKLGDGGCDPRRAGGSRY